VLTSASSQQWAMMIFSRWPLAATVWWFVLEEVNTIGNNPLTVMFHNHCEKPMDLYFVGAQPEWKERIAPEMKTGQDTFIGHKFEVRVEGIKPARVAVQGAGDVRCVLDPSGRAIHLKAKWLPPMTEADIYKGPRWDELVSQAEQKCLQDLVGYPEDAAHFCNRREVFTIRSGALKSKFDMDDSTWQQWAEPEQEKRRWLLDNQAPGLHNFTKVGFEARSIPADLYHDLRDFWKRSRRTSSLENHPHLDPNLSCRKSDTWKLELDWSMKERIANTLAPIIAKWANVDVNKIRKTSIYGIRMYRKDALLENHVDRKDTHVLSAILEVGYLGFSTPGVDEGDDHAENWPLEIMDHNGKWHSVKNRPGQLILYESATCPHGRPKHFTGREYAGVFVHFAPHGWPEAFEGRRAEL